MPYFVLVVKDTLGKRVIPLTNIYYSVGRAPESHVRLFDTFVSREHALIIRIPEDHGQGYRFRVFDGGSNSQPSTNGVYVNGQAVRSHPLQLGDVVHFGPKASATLERVDRLDESTLAELMGDTTPTSECPQLRSHLEPVLAR
jgi:pSer/pThr/pTyr-binding forkhead associated (FHA) protein